MSLFAEGTKLTREDNVYETGNAEQLNQRCAFQLCDAVAVLVGVTFRLFPASLHRPSHGKPL